MLFYLFLSLIALACYLVYTYYIKPRNQCKHYVKLFKSMGYRVYELPFKPLSATIYDLYNSDSQTKGDALYTNKTVFQDYDIIVTNIVHYP